MNKTLSKINAVLLALMFALLTIEPIISFAKTLYEKDCTYTFGSLESEREFDFSNFPDDLGYGYLFTVASGSSGNQGSGSYVKYTNVPIIIYRLTSVTSANSGGNTKSVFNYDLSYNLLNNTIKEESGSYSVIVGNPSYSSPFSSGGFIGVDLSFPNVQYNYSFYGWDVILTSNNTIEEIYELYNVSLPSGSYTINDNACVYLYKDRLGSLNYTTSSTEIAEKSIDTEIYRANKKFLDIEFQDREVPKWDGNILDYAQSVISYIIPKVKSFNFGSESATDITSESITMTGSATGTTYTYDVYSCYDYDRNTNLPVGSVSSPGNGNNSQIINNNYQTVYNDNSTNTVYNIENSTIDNTYTDLIPQDSEDKEFITSVEDGLNNIDISINENLNPFTFILRWMKETFTEAVNPPADTRSVANTGQLVVGLFGVDSVINLNDVVSYFGDGWSWMQTCIQAMLLFEMFKAYYHLFFTKNWEK